VPSLDIIDNVVPFISKEEEKMEIEALKLLALSTVMQLEMRTSSSAPAATESR